MTEERRDLALLQGGAVILYHAPAALSADTGWLRAHGYRIAPCECARWPERSAAGLASALGGRLGGEAINLDALADLLRTLALPVEGGLALVLHSYDSFARRDRTRAQALLDVLAEGSRFQLVYGRRLLILVQSNDPRIRFEPVGATPVDWNEAEWMDEARGL